MSFQGQMNQRTEAEVEPPSQSLNAEVTFVPLKSSIRIISASHALEAMVRCQSTFLVMTNKSHVQSNNVVICLSILSDLSAFVEDYFQQQIISHLVLSIIHFQRLGCDLHAFLCGLPNIFADFLPLSVVEDLYLQCTFESHEESLLVYPVFNL